ncbi:MAG: S8 family serine peptidase, partial [Candidatus Thermoplasmatota archaeon]|nr:S8 family serine peptidase [Candidatus Thermoplasmatota archaeon]
MRSSSAMRTALAVLIILLFAPFGGVLAGSAGQPVDLGIEGDEILPTYSRAVQLAFERVGDMSGYSEEDLSGTHEWLVVTRVPIDKHPWTKAAPESSESAPILRGAYIWQFEYPLRSIPLLQQSLEAGEIESFSPLVEKKQNARLAPDDTEFAAQWHLENTGQTNGLPGEDANVTDTWDTYTGSGVVISVIDDGLDHEHSDLQPHYSALFSYDWCDDDGDPSPTGWNGHGTAVAGVAAAVGNNALDVTGVAFNATIAGSTLIACWASDATEADALSYESDDIDIYTNSWGPYDDGERLEGPGPLTLAAFESDAYNGREGLGNLITWAAGNGLGSNDDSNYDGYANSRFTIAVTAISHQGEQSSYAEPGANILVAAHSNGAGEGITTTDITGSGGYNSSGNVTHDFGGTSSATPLAAGVIALILDANENLTWRDVQHVLVNSARMNDASDSSWSVNGAGHDISHKYGFGAVDAGAAVSVAENWVNVGEELNATYGPYTPSLDIPDDDNSWSEVTAVVTDEYSLESVDVSVDITHSARGDLDIVLVSPLGTESWLAETHGDDGNDYSDWMFSTVRHWDESSLGTWTLKVRDTSSGDNGTLDTWESILHGVDVDYDHDDDGLSDENETLLYGTDPYDADSDDDGLNDYDEVMGYGTDPLVIDSDTDGLTDAAEVLSTFTDPLDSDTDDDGLSDGAEVNYWSSDPLVYDPDDDSDLFYHFNDCNDTNPNVNPGRPELLNGIDDNCDDYIDEGYNFTDRDNDGLKDWIEYHVHGT